MRAYKIRCKGSYDGFTPGCEYLGHIGYGPFGNLGMNTIDDDCDKRTLDLDSDDFEYIPPVTYSAVDDFLAEQDDDEDD
ncbi:hypothetical protein OHE94_04935 [Escherichia coli]|uniref:hypothetical protein n=1 Tax=Escherichia coli TaxID=562 RepID=UPI0021E72D69|nr:hypothetical protein [Escherichia coli]MCV2895954.1 hypothetical protein [Escherichia coli]